MIRVINSRDDHIVGIHVIASETLVCLQEMQFSDQELFFQKCGCINRPNELVSVFYIRRGGILMNQGFDIKLARYIF